MNVLSLLFHSNNAVGAHRRAKSAGNTFAFVRNARGVVALTVNRALGDFYEFFGAGVHAEAAALA